MHSSLERTAIGRTLIPRYFRSIFEGGVTELYFHMRHNKESFQQTSVTLDCEQCTMITNHGKPMLTKVCIISWSITSIVLYQLHRLKSNGTTNHLIHQVCTEGRLLLEFIYDDYMRIKSWHMNVRGHKEMLPRNVITNLHHGPQTDPQMVEQLAKNITRMGITNSTLNYLRVSAKRYICIGNGV